MSDEFKTAYTGSRRTDWNAYVEELNRTVQAKCDRSNRKAKEPENGIDCPKCLNKKFIYTVEYDDTGIGEIVAHECECVRKHRIVENAKRSGLERLIGKKLDDFQTVEPWQKEAKDKASRFMKRPSGWFVILGQAGSGKTLLCSIVANQLLREGFIIEYHSWNEIMRRANAEWFSNAEVLNPFKTAPFLFIDDFLKSGTDSRSLDVAYGILNYRYLKKLPTIISGEKTAADLMQIDEALASRIVEMSGEYLISFGHDPKRNQRVKGVTR